MDISTQEGHSTDCRPPYFLPILPRHYWVISLFTLLGLGAATFVFQRTGSSYESRAKLLIPITINRDAEGRDHAQFADQIMDTEEVILTSRDLAMEVAKAIGPSRLLTRESKGGASVIEAASTISRGLRVEISEKTAGVIQLVYRNTDPDLVVEILQTFIDRYRQLHLQIHRAGQPLEAVDQETDKLRKLLHQTENELKELRAASTASPEALIPLKQRRKKYEDTLQLLEKKLDMARIEGESNSNEPWIKVLQKPSKPVKISLGVEWLLVISFAIGGPAFGSTMGAHNLAAWVARGRRGSLKFLRSGLSFQPVRVQGSDLET